MAHRYSKVLTAPRYSKVLTAHRYSKVLMARQDSYKLATELQDQVKEAMRCNRCRAGQSAQA